MVTPNPTQPTIDFPRGLPEGLERFGVIEGPRSSNATPHPFGFLHFMALGAMLCGMDTCEDFVGFAKAREPWLRKWMILPNGIPYGNTILRVFAAMPMEPIRGKHIFAALVPAYLESIIGLRQMWMPCRSFLQPASLFAIAVARYVATWFVLILASVDAFGKYAL